MIVQFIPPEIMIESTIHFYFESAVFCGVLRQPTTVHLGGRRGRRERPWARHVTYSMQNLWHRQPAIGVEDEYLQARYEAKGRRGSGLCTTKKAKVSERRNALQAWIMKAIGNLATNLRRQGESVPHPIRESIFSGQFYSLKPHVNKSPFHGHCA